MIYTIMYDNMETYSFLYTLRLKAHGKEAKMKIGLVTPSAPAPGLFPERFRRGVNALETLGLDVKSGSFVTTLDGVVAASAQKRAQDINNMFNDENVGLLMATIGGDYSAEILQYLDWEIIRENKKGLVGYSDITILLHAIGIKAQQVVFYGPTLMTEFAEYPVPPKLSETAFLELFSENESLTITPCDVLLAKGSDWALPPKERIYSCKVTQKVIRAGKATGIVLGGCIEALDRIRGTEFWPNFEDSILIIETVDDDFNEKKWRSLITDYYNMGVFKDISGIVIGQKIWSKESEECLAKMLLDVTEEKQIPILYGLPFGHISPIATLPLFTRATLDTDTMSLIYKKPFKYEYIMR